MKVNNFQCSEIKEGIHKLKEIKENFRPDLFIIYMPYNYFEDKNFNLINEAVNSVENVIISTVATVKDDQLIYNSIGGVALKFEKNGKISIKSKNDISQNIKSSASFLEKSLIPESYGTNLIFSTSSNLSVHRILSSIFNKQQGIRLYGGVASSDAEDFRTYLSHNGKIIKDGFLILNLYNIYSFNTVSMGFIPIGTTYTVTKAKDNKIYSLDDMPVSYFLNNILNNTGVSIEDLDPVNTSQIMWEFPFLFIDEEGHISHLLVPMMYDPVDGGYAFYGEVVQGSKVKLSTGDSEDILIDVKLRAGEFKNICLKRGYPDLIFNITCTARNFVLLSDKKEKEEQKIYHQHLKKSPITGFLTFGEIGPDRMGKPGKFYNETSILIGLVEK
ncbi:MAG TPA: hypothetical protein ENK22_02670 [Persephonella sp.]|nr:hypothetical protein [Persephonella sp.]